MNKIKNNFKKKKISDNIVNEEKIEVKLKENDVQIQSQTGHNIDFENNKEPQQSVKSPNWMDLFKRKRGSLKKVDEGVENLSLAEEKSLEEKNNVVDGNEKPKVGKSIRQFNEIITLLKNKNKKMENEEENYGERTKLSIKEEDTSAKEVEIPVKEKEIPVIDEEKQIRKGESETSLKIFLDKETETDLTWEQLKVQKLKEGIEFYFLFPSYWKKITWSLGAAWIVCCLLSVLILSWHHGNQFAVFYINVVILGLSIMWIFVQPLYILIISICTLNKFKFDKILSYHQIPTDIFKNPKEEDKRAKVDELRLMNAGFYGAVSSQSLYSRKMDLRDEADIRHILLDIIFYLIFSAVILNIVYGNRSDQAFFSTAAIRSLLVTADYTNSIPLQRVRTYHQFIEYMNKTLIPAILSKEDWVPFKGPVSPSPIPAGAKDGYLNTKMMDRGWTKEPALKLISIPRLRQQRVLSKTCELHAALTKSYYECNSELGIGTTDNGDYGVAWKPLHSSEKSLNYSQLLPWRYNNESTSKDMQWYGRLNYLAPYSGGGYILELGKTVTNARSILNYMYFFNWIDFRTRVIFVDFTIYSPGANLYNVISVMFEVSATGVFIPSPKIHTERLLFPTIYKFHLFIIELIIFTILFFDFIMKQFSVLLAVGFTAYFKELWTILDFLLIIFGILSILTTVAAIFHVSFLLEELNKAANNKFVSFQIAVFWHKLQTYADAFVVAIVTGKMFRLLTFTVTFYRWERVLRDAWWPISGLFLIFLCSVLVFALYFKGTLQTYEEEFTTVWGSMFTMLAHTTRRHDVYNSEFLTHIPAYIGPLFFGMFLLFSSYLVFTTFATILSVHLKSIHSQQLRTHFHIWEYFKSIMDNKEGKKHDEKLIPKNPITLYPRRFNVIMPYLDEVRLQGMKRVALQVCNEKDYMEETAINVSSIVLGGNSKRQGTDKYNITYTETDKIIIGELRINAMMEVAQGVLKERNEYLMHRHEND